MSAIEGESHVDIDEHSLEEDDLDPQEREEEFLSFFNVSEMPPPISLEEQTEIITQLRESEENSSLIQRSVEGNLEALHGLSEKYWEVVCEYGLDWEEVLSAGKEGLMEALNTWDPTGDTYFSQSRANCVNGAVRRLLREETGLGRVNPTAFGDYLILKEEVEAQPVSQLAKALNEELRDKLSVVLGEPPTEKQMRFINKYGFRTALFGRLGIARQDIVERADAVLPKNERAKFISRLDLLAKFAGNPKKIQTLVELIEGEYVSYDTSVEFENGEELLLREVFGGERSEVPAKAEIRLMRETVNETLKSLKPRQEFVIRTRFGIGGRGLSAEEMVEEVSREELLPDALKELPKGEQVEHLKKMEEELIEGVVRKWRNDEPLQKLSDLEFHVLLAGRGMRDRGMALADLGDLLGVTQERIRQIEADGLRKLRNYPRKRKLEDYRE